MKILLLCVLVVSVVRTDPACRFAASFERSSLAKSDTFLQKVVEKEVVFLREQGTDQTTGLSVDSVTLDERTGMPLSRNSGLDLRNEALHLGVLTKAVACHSLLNEFLGREEALTTLKLKITSLTQLPESLKSIELYYAVKQLLKVIEGESEPEILS